MYRCNFRNEVAQLSLSHEGSETGSGSGVGAEMSLKVRSRSEKSFRIRNIVINMTVRLDISVPDP
jgi:hypothetical protein